MKILIKLLQNNTYNLWFGIVLLINIFLKYFLQLLLT